MRTTRDLLIALLFIGGYVVAAMAALAAAGGPARAQTYQAALEKFSADSFGETEAGIAAVAASGTPWRRG